MVETGRNCQGYNRDWDNWSSWSSWTPDTNWSSWTPDTNWASWSRGRFSPDDWSSWTPSSWTSMTPSSWTSWTSSSDDKKDDTSWTTNISIAILIAVSVCFGMAFCVSMCQNNHVQETSDTGPPQTRAVDGSISAPFPGTESGGTGITTEPSAPPDYDTLLLQYQQDITGVDSSLNDRYDNDCNRFDQNGTHLESSNIQHNLEQFSNIASNLHHDLRDNSNMASNYHHDSGHNSNMTSSLHDNLENNFSRASNLHENLEHNSNMADGQGQSIPPPPTYDDVVSNINKYTGQGYKD